MISKKEASGQLSRYEQEQIAECEEKINEALKAYAGNPIFVEFTASAKVLDRLVAAYSKPEMGWKVTRSVSDKGDGSGLLFE